MTSDNYVLLSVEDSDSDFHLIKMAVRDWGPQLTVCRAYDGEQAIAFLSQTGEFERVPRPDLILLDAQLPKLDGFGVLEYIQSSAELSSVSVVMFTTLSEALIVNRALSLGARAVIRKPVRFDEFRQQLKAVYLNHLHSMPEVA
jgi:CheY-like chemotaxis protein